MVRTITTAVEASSSLRVGHFTFFNSVLASLKNCPVLLNIRENALSPFSFFAWTTFFEWAGRPLPSPLHYPSFPPWRSPSSEKNPPRSFSALNALCFLLSGLAFSSHICLVFQISCFACKKRRCIKERPLLFLSSNHKLPPDKWQARRDSNPQHPDLETGALAVRATGLQEEDLFCFLMECMGPAKSTIFFKPNLSGVFLLFFVVV